VHQPLGPTDEHGHGKLSYAAYPVPKRMGQLGAMSPLKHIRGFFYPVKEKPEIQAALDELEAQEAAGELEPGPTERSESERELTD
jgi:ubiquinol-cytochrome c reductase cytochrome b subunit